MKKILLDINIVMDVLQKREPYYSSSAYVLSLCAEKKIKGFISAVSFGTIHYLLTKTLGAKKALACIQKIRSITEIALVNEEVVDLALQSDFSDFEDAIQYFCATYSKLDFLITRNKKDFSRREISVVTPDEFLSILAQLVEKKCQ